jgi:hypothetical protein
VGRNLEGLGGGIATEFYDGFLHGRGEPNSYGQSPLQACPRARAMIRAQ